MATDSTNNHMNCPRGGWETRDDKQKTVIPVGVASWITSPVTKTTHSNVLICNTKSKKNNHKYLCSLSCFMNVTMKVSNTEWRMFRRSEPFNDINKRKIFFFPSGGFLMFFNCQNLMETKFQFDKRVRKARNLPFQCWTFSCERCWSSKTVVTVEWRLLLEDVTCQAKKTKH